MTETVSEKAGMAFPGGEAIAPAARRATRRPGPPELSRNVRRSASSIVEEELRQGIIAMRLKPGEALNEKEIAAQFGVSRTPVREAMLRLKDDELIEIFPQSGTFVSRIPIHTIPEAVVIRQGLEAMAVEHAARRRDAGAIARLQAIIEEQKAAESQGNQSRFYEADEEFHAAISDAAGFPGIWRLAQTVKAQVDRCRRLTLPVPGRMARVVIEHQRILDAIASGQGEAARKALNDHLHTVLPDLQQLQKENPEFFV